MRNHAPILLQQIKTKICYYIIKLRENKLFRREQNNGKTESRKE